MNAYLSVAEINVAIPFFLGALMLITLLTSVIGTSPLLFIPPILLFIGVPASVATASCNSLIVAAVLPGAITHLRQGNVDWLLALLLVIGGLAGATVGLNFIKVLIASGQFDVFFTASNALLLALTGTLLSIDFLKKSGRPPRLYASKSGGVLFDAMRIRFGRASIDANPATLLVIGFFAGSLMPLTGISGEFILVPILVYLLRVSVNVAIGTTAAVIALVGSATITVQGSSGLITDFMLLALLIVGCVAGATLGAALGRRSLRIRRQLLPVLALGAFLAAFRLVLPRAVPPIDLFSISSPF